LTLINTFRKENSDSRWKPVEPFTLVVDFERTVTTDLSRAIQNEKGQSEDWPKSLIPLVGTV
jgi:hypothetical protein